MKKLISLIFIIALISCQSGNKKQQEENAPAPSAEVVETTINIGGMHCDMCVASVEKGVNELDGIVSVKVSLEDSTAVVSYDKSVVAQTNIEKAIENRGYRIKTEQ
jgi:Cu+-exporting ATPase